MEWGDCTAPWGLLLLEEEEPGGDVLGVIWGADHPSAGCFAVPGCPAPQRTCQCRGTSCSLAPWGGREKVICFINSVAGGPIAERGPSDTLPACSRGRGAGDVLGLAGWPVHRLDAPGLAMWQGGVKCPICSGKSVSPSGSDPYTGAALSSHPTCSISCGKPSPSNGAGMWGLAPSLHRCCSLGLSWATFCWPPRAQQNHPVLLSCTGQTLAVLFINPVSHIAVALDSILFKPVNPCLDSPPPVGSEAPQLHGGEVCAVGDPGTR